MDDFIIVTENLIKHYKSAFGRDGVVEAVRGINLAVRRGEIFGLVGPDGAGKTTTVQMLCGILDPTSGRATVAGFDTVKDAAAIGERIGYMSEGFTLYSTLSVDENLEFFADLYKVPPEERQWRKEELLHFSRLTPFADRRAEQLSGGMQKKLALACTLIHSPQILFLDEPTTGVDPVSRRDFWKILYDFLAEGVTIFVTTPYMDEAERCHRVALMSQGEIIRRETPANLKREMRGEAVELVARPQKRAVDLLKRAEGVSQLQVFGDRLHLLVQDGEGEVSRLRSLLISEGITVEGLRRTLPSVEDVFIAAITETEQKELRELRELPSGPSVVPSDDYAVTVSELTKRFDGFTAVDNVTFQVKPGEIFGFLGPNGSGKTTTIRMLCGLLPPTAGTGTVAGYDIVSDQAAIKPRIGYMSQKFSLYKDMTVEENIDLFAGVYEVPRKRRAERKRWVLEMAGLVGKEGSLTKDLAGGWKQRLALGCAILHEPQILFLDEPTSGVDPLSRRQFWDLIFEIASQGVTVFVTTHYLDEAEHCHDLGLLYQGRLIAQGSPRELREGMRAGELVEVECDNPLQALDYVSALPFSLHAAIFGAKLHVLVEDAEEAMAKMPDILRAKGIDSRYIQQVPLSLEDVFIIFVEMVERGMEGS